MLVAAVSIAFSCPIFVFATSVVYVLARFCAASSCSTFSAASVVALSMTDVSNEAAFFANVENMPPTANPEESTSTSPPSFATCSFFCFFLPKKVRLGTLSRLCRVCTAALVVNGNCNKSGDGDGVGVRLCCPAPAVNIAAFVLSSARLGAALPVHARTCLHLCAGKGAGGWGAGSQKKR